jgi:mono/diheme cytochrome c family protein
VFIISLWSISALYRASPRAHGRFSLTSGRSIPLKRKSILLMKTTGGYFKGAIIAVLFVWGVASLAPSANGQKGDTAALPEGAGRSLMLQACVQCHDFKSIVSQRKTAAAWRRTVNEMIWRGAPLLADEAAVLTDYLAAAFKPDSSSSSRAAAKTPAPKAEENQWAKYLPAGEGRSLVLQACVQCHDLKTVVARRATASSWRRNVNKMVALGARLTAGEAAIVAKYLAASFGPEIPASEELKKKQ